MDSCKIRAKEKKHFRNTFLRSCLHIQKKSSNFACKIVTRYLKE